MLSANGDVVKISVDCEVYGFHKLFSSPKDAFDFFEDVFDETVTEIIIKKRPDTDGSCIGQKD